MQGTFQGVQSAWSAQSSLPSNPSARTAETSLQEAARHGMEEQHRPPPFAAATELSQAYTPEHEERRAVCTYLGRSLPRHCCQDSRAPCHTALLRGCRSHPHTGIHPAGRSPEL